MTAPKKTKAARATKAPRARRDGQPPLSAVLGHGDLPTSLLFVFPLFLIYEMSVLFAPAMNGVDFVSKNLFAVLGYSKQNYLLFHVALALVFAAFLIWRRRRRGRFDSGRFLPMLLEASIFALTAGSLIMFVMRHVLGMNPQLATGGLEHGWTGVVLSLGAGVHEELVFRLGLCAGGGALLRLCGVSHGTAMAIAFFVSSALFSAAHHIGAYGDPWSTSVFTYRLLAGLLFASLFYFRSLATSVYTHAIYDLYVMLILH